MAQKTISNFIPSHRHVLLWTTLAMSGLAHAEDPAAGDQSNVKTLNTAPGAAGLEEVVVTALKRDQSLLDAPAAVTAISGDLLRSQNITTLEDVGLRIPGFSVGTALGVTNVAIRGVAISGIVPGREGPIAIHQDGAYLPQATSLDYLFMDVADVEVLRGPQGTLYGRNATGGAINFVPRLPTRDFSGYVNASAANYETYRFEGAVSGPLSDSLAARAYVLGSDGMHDWLTNLATGKAFGGREQYGGRTSLRYEADALSVDVAGNYFHQVVRPASTFVQFTPVSPTLLATPPFNAGPISSDPRRPSQAFEGKNVQENKGVTTNVMWSRSEQFALEWRTAYTDLEQTLTDLNGTALVVPTLRGVDNPTRNETVQSELRLSGTAVNDALDWSLGLFAFDDTQDTATDYQLYAPLFPNGAHSVGKSRIDTKSVAAYLEQTVKLSDSVNVYGGVRWSHDDREGSFERYLMLASGTTTSNCPTRIVTAEDSFENVSGKAGVQYKPTVQSQVYGQWQQGFKAGGFNPISCAGTFEPEKVDAFEIGYKASLLEGNLDLSTAAFHYSYTNMQVAQYFERTSVISNAGASTIAGAEVETKWRPTASLSVDLAVSWLPVAEYDSFRSSDPLNVALGVQDLSGNRLILAPEFTSNLGLEYSFAMLSGQLTVRGEYYHNSGVYFRPYEIATEKQGSYDIGNLFLRYEPAAGHWSLRAWVRNIDDVEYAVAGVNNDSLGTVGAFYSQPRSYGVGIEYQW